MLFPFLGYIVASTVLTAVAVLLTGLVNTVTLEKGRHHPPPVIARTVKVEVQRHSPVAKEASSAKDASPVAKEALPAKDASLVAKEASSAKDASPAAKEASPAKDVSSFVATAKADTKKSKHYKPKVFAYKPKVLARQRDNYRYGNALGYAQEYGYGPRAPFFQ
jgi:hypothetical protein